MGESLVQKLLPALEKATLPDSAVASELGRQTYEVGIDRVDEFIDDPQVLADAIRIFQSGESRPYALAGIAYTLLKAAREKDDIYAENGITSALSWLERAQELAPNVNEINVVEALAYIYGRRFEDARLVLDYLESIEPNNYHILKTEMTYWQFQGNLEKAIELSGAAMAAAETVPRKLSLRQNLGDLYLQNKQYEDAIEVYEEALHFSQENVWLWHNLSLAYWRVENYEEAERCNKQVLELRPDFPTALKMEKALKEKLNTGGFSRRLFGR